MQPAYRDTVVWWSVHLNLDRAVPVQVPDGDIVLCSWKGQTSLYPGVQIGTTECEFNAGGNPAMD